MADHVKPIIYNTIGSIISTLLLTGGLAVILWAKGLPFHWALSLAVGLVFILSLSVYLVSLAWAAWRRQGDNAGSNATGQTESERAALERIGDQNDQLQVDLHLAEKEVATLKSDKGRLTRETAKLEKSLETSQRELADAKTQLETRELQLVTANIERNRLDEQLQQAQRDLKQANLRANQEESQRDIWMKNANEAERKLGDLGWLEGRMKQQAENLDIWVRIKKANRVNLQLSTTPRRVIIAFWVKNNSIFTVTFNFKFLDGCLRFKGSPLHDPIRPSKRSIPIQDVEPGACLEIILLQPLLRTEAETIQDARQNGDPNAIFSLADLNIPFFVRNIPQEVGAAKLKIHSEIEFMEASEFPCDKNVDELDIS